MARSFQRGRKITVWRNFTLGFLYFCSSQQTSRAEWNQHVGPSLKTSWPPVALRLKASSSFWSSKFFTHKVSFLKMFIKSLKQLLVLVVFVKQTGETVHLGESLRLFCSIGFLMVCFCSCDSLKHTETSFIYYCLISETETLFTVCFCLFALLAC